MQRLILSVLMIPALAATAFCREPVSLIDPEKPAEGWEFGSGPEFPGAQGKLEVAAEPFRSKPVLSLHGDYKEPFTYAQRCRTFLS